MSALPNIFPTVRGQFMVSAAISCREMTDAHPETPMKTMATPARLELATGRLEGGAAFEKACVGNGLHMAHASAATMAPEIGGAL